MKVIMSTPHKKWVGTIEFVRRKGKNETRKSKKIALDGFDPSTFGL
jgi:hypothetical protein